MMNTRAFSSPLRSTTIFSHSPFLKLFVESRGQVLCDSSRTRGSDFSHDFAREADDLADGGELVGGHVHRFGVVAFRGLHQRFGHAGDGSIADAEEVFEHALAEIELDVCGREIGSVEVDSANCGVGRDSAGLACAMAV